MYCVTRKFDKYAFGNEYMSRNQAPFEDAAPIHQMVGAESQSRPWFALGAGNKKVSSLVSYFFRAIGH